MYECAFGKLVPPLLQKQLFHELRSWYNGTTFQKLNQLMHSCRFCTISWHLLHNARKPFDDLILRDVAKRAVGRSLGVDVVFDCVKQALKKFVSVLHHGSAECRVQVGEHVRQAAEVAGDRAAEGLLKEHRQPGDRGRRAALATPVCIGRQSAPPARSATVAVPTGASDSMSSCS